MWSNQNVHLLLVGERNGTATLQDSLAVSYKINTLSSLNPVIRLLDIYSKELKVYAHTNTCTGMFIAALLTIAQTWKEPRRPSGGGCKNKLWWYIQTLWGTLMEGAGGELWGMGTRCSFCSVSL